MSTEAQAAFDACIAACEAEGRKLDVERETGHHSLKDERRARAESAYYCAHLCREALKAATKEVPAR